MMVHPRDCYEVVDDALSVEVWRYVWREAWREVAWTGVGGQAWMEARDQVWVEVKR